MYYKDEIKPGMLGYLRNTVWAGFIYGLAALVFGIFIVMRSSAISNTASMLLAPFGFGLAMMRGIGVVAVLLGLLQLWASFRMQRELKNDKD